MSDCLFNFKLHAFHDGELDTELAHEVREHLATCRSCQIELADLQAVSGLFAAKAVPEMSSLELARLHNSLKVTAKKSANPQVASRLAEVEFLRTAGMLSALAASILIISSVWLVEIPSRHAAALSPGVAVVPASDLGFLPADTPNWERTALTLQVEPLSQSQNSGGLEEPQLSQIGLADSRSFGNNMTGGDSIDGQVADWMVAGLSSDGAGGGGHANP